MESSQADPIPSYRAPKPIRPGVVNFTDRIKSLVVRYLSHRLPHHDDLDQWIVSPLYQHGRDVPVEDDGRSSIVLLHAETLRNLLSEYDHQMERKRVRKRKRSQAQEEPKPSSPLPELDDEGNDQEDFFPSPQKKELLEDISDSELVHKHELEDGELPEDEDNQLETSSSS